MAATDVQIKSAKPKDKSYKLSDEKGLFLLIKPTGSKLWQMKYRFDGKEKLLSFGAYPEVTLKEARDKSEAARKILRNQIDPSEVRKAQKAARIEAASNSFEAVASEWFEKQKKNQQWQSTSYAKRVIGMLSKNLFPWIGQRPIADITPKELLDTLRKTESRGVLETANRTKQIAGEVFRYAVVTGRAERDITQDLKGALATPAKKNHYAAITEPKAVGRLMRDISSYQGTPVVKAALMLSALLFQRPGEIRTMLWAEIDFEKAEWRYLVTKTNTQHIVPLSRQAITVLRELQPLTGRGSYVLPSARGASRPLSENGVRVALRGMGYDNNTMTGHGFRAMARTILDEVLGFRVDWIEHQLAHAVKDPNGRAYNRTAHLDGRKQMMQKWADYLEGLGQ
jgi:integrase